VLAHYLEEEGIPTTQISLIRLNTENIKPPRALWVPFELGRPLGVPNDPDFQKKVLVTALRLFEAPAGPVLEDYPEEAPATDEPVALACPILIPEPETDMSETEKLCRDFKREMTSLRPWYDRALKERTRTAVGVSKLTMDETADFLCSFLGDEQPQNPREEVPFDKELRFTADDVKAYYYEAITAQPGADKLLGEAIESWFWKDTLAARVLRAVKDSLTDTEDEAMKTAGARTLVPQKYA